MSKKMIKINIEKAKEITKKRLRSEREPILKQLDIEFMLALETNNSDELQRVTKEKQRLRDITSSKELIKAKKVESLLKIKVSQ